MQIDFKFGIPLKPNFYLNQNSVDFINIYGFCIGSLDKDEPKIYFGIDLNTEELECQQNQANYRNIIQTLYSQSTEKYLLKPSFMVNQILNGKHLHGIVCSFPYNRTLSFYHKLTAIPNLNKPLF